MLEIVQGGTSGELRLSQGETTKSIFFRAGTAVNAASSLPSEQIDHKLIKEGRVTPGLIETARRRQSDTCGLGGALVEIGVITEDVMLAAARELAMQVALSPFEWEDGEYSFEEGSEDSVEALLDCSTFDLILEGARRAAGIARLANANVPPDKLVAQADITANPMASARLSQTESYVLMRTDSPVQVSEVSLLTGLPEDETQRAVSVLVTLGLLRVVEPEKKQVQPAAKSGASSESAAVTSEKAPDSLMEGIKRKLQVFETANHYEVLGVNKIAPMSLIKSAYNELELMFRSYRNLYPDDRELKNKLDELFAKVKKAYEILGDPDKRRAYDRPSEPRMPPTTLIERGEALPISRAPLHASPATNQGARPAAASHPIAAPMSQPTAQTNGGFEVSEVRQPGVLNTPQAAAHFYQQGRARYDNGDIHGAEHMLRQAVRLEPNEWHYHYYLGLTLAVLSQARHNHAHHEGCHVTCKIGAGLVRNQRVRHEAEQHLLKAAELDATNPKIRLNLALLYKEAGMTKKAEQYFYETLLLDGKNKTALKELGLDSAPPSKEIKSGLTLGGLFKR